jgi:hypothetical protein
LGNKKQEEVDEVRKEIQQLHMQEIQAEGPTHEMKMRLEMLQQTLSDTKYKIDEELFTRQSYLYMLDRMKRDFIAAKIQSSEHEKALRNKASILDFEQQKQRKIKEERLQAKSIFEGLLKNVEKEQKDRRERIFELQKCI